MAFRPNLVGYGFASVVAAAWMAPAAALPAPAWLGVERVAVACDFGDSAPALLRDGLCEALAAEARARTAYPVHVARDGAARMSLDGAAGTLVLKVSGRVEDDTGRVRTLHLATRLERPAPIGWQGPSRSSSLRFQWDGGSVALLDPVRPFTAVLPQTTESRRPRLPRQF